MRNFSITTIRHTSDRPQTVRQAEKQTCGQTDRRQTDRTLTNLISYGHDRCGFGEGDGDNFGEFSCGENDGENTVKLL